MHKIFIDLDKKDINKEHRNKLILFISDSLIVYKNGYIIEFWSCSEDLLGSVQCVADIGSYENIELEDHLIFIIDNENCLIFDKNSHELTLRKIDFGRIISKIYEVDDHLMFLALYNNRMQIIKYNFQNDIRSFQSQSWEGSVLTGFGVYNDKAMSIIDSSMIVCCDTSKCRTLWTRFESGRIGRGVNSYKDGILYVCQQSLRMRKDGQTETYSLPFARVDSIEGKIDDVAYLASNEFKDIYAYDLKRKKEIWEITGLNPINEMIIGSGKQNGKLCHVGIIKAGNKMGIINLDTGQLVYYFDIPDAYRIRHSNNYILINQREEKSIFI